MTGEIFASIITVCFNSEETIQETIESVMAQTIDDFEYIIIDGQSTDRTLSIIEQYIPKFKGKLRIISEKDAGIYDAMNKGICLAKGKLICLLNSDDWFEIDAIEKIKKAYKGNRYEIVYGMQRTITDGMVENCVMYRHEFLPKRMICHQASFTTREIFTQFGAFSTDYYSASDYDFMLRVYRNKEVVFTPIQEVIVNFRSGGMSNSYIAIVETARLQYRYGFITKGKMYLGYLKSLIWRIKQLKNQMRRK